MFAFLLRRVARAVAVLLGASLGVFLLLRVAPGDPARLFLPEIATDQEVAALRRELGLDRPLPTQYAIFLRDALRGNLGTSYLYREPALSVALGRLPATVALAGCALGFAVLIALPLGLIAAIRRDSWLDYGGSVGALVGQSAPNFWTGAMLVVIFAVWLRWLPTSGLDEWRSFILPTVSLGLFQTAILYRLTRASVLQVLAQEYVRTARAKGLSEATVRWRHVLRNTLIPIITVGGFQFGQLLGGAAVIETLFAWPGIGKLGIDAILRRDYPVVQVVLLLSTSLFIGVNLLVDLLYSVVDPRIRRA